MIGLSTYGYRWRMDDSAEQPMTLLDLVGEAQDLGVSLVQICDYPKVESLSADELAEVKQAADKAGISFELGTRGVDRATLMRYLALAETLEASFVRTMLGEVVSKQDRDLAIASLRECLPAYTEQHVAIGIETHELVASSDIRHVIEAVDSPDIGVCLDPGNAVARLEHPTDVVELLAPYVLNIHVKDFTFERNEGSMGFLLVGCPLGEGLLDYDAMIEVVEPEARGINLIIEHWVPWQGTSADTCRLEERWTRHNLNVLRRKS